MKQILFSFSYCLRITYMHIVCFYQIPPVFLPSLHTANFSIYVCVDSGGILKLRHKLYAARQPRCCEMTLLIIPLCSCILQWTRDEGLPLAPLHYWKWLLVLRRGIPYTRCFLTHWIQSKLSWWDYKLRKYLNPRSSPEPHLNGECF